ncbi:MAG TPA: hypothetical protein DCL77_15815, partial [Prolixibacteraceae bacterium]|nr:hypothetical protein [Prolixibacteraceae bacterium]
MKYWRKYLLLIFSVLIFLAASIEEHHALSPEPEKELIQAFQQTLLKQQYNISVYLNSIERQITNTIPSANYATTFSKLNKLFDTEGFGFIIMKDQEMVYWSSNHFSFPNISSRLSGKEGIVVLPNGTYAFQKRLLNHYQIIGLIHLRNDYSYENQFLVNNFVKPFRLPPDFEINTQKDKNSYAIHNLTNRYLFSVVPTGAMRFNNAELYFTAFLYLLGLVFLLLALYRKMDDYHEESFGVKMIILTGILFVIYWIHILFGIPAILNHLELFSAKYYAVTQWLPSLGDFFLLTTLLFFWSLVFVKEFVLHGRARKLMIIPCFLFAGTLYQVVGGLISNLISNSNITYKLNRITDIDQYSISSHLAIALLLFSIFMINLKILEKTEHLINKRTFLSFHLVAVPVSILLCIIFNTPPFYLLALFLCVNLLQVQIRKMHITRFSLSYSILFVSLFSVVSLMVVYKTIDQREIQVQKLMAVNLSSEQDPVAEIFLTNMQEQFNTDSIIPSLLAPPYEDLENYLNRNYFDGYFRKYDIQYTFCTATDAVMIHPENVSEPCFPYFDKMIVRSGTRIPGSNFYFMNNMEGRVSYLGKLHYPLARDSRGLSVFITMTSKTISEGIGFPELLMDRSLIKPFRYKYLSYAKYFDDELVNRSGEYTYNYYLQSYNIDHLKSEFELRKWNGYDHLIYQFDDKTCIIVSNRSLRFVDYLISFPYIFVFYFLVVLLLTLIGNPKLRKLMIPRDLRFRIQVAIISVVLISLLMVAAGTIYYNVKEYQNRHQTDLLEKMNSISVEIDSRLNTVNAISPELRQWLFEELYKLSNIFRTDINIYDVKGEIIASSRPEIFRKGITSERMNAQAF